MGIDYSVNLYYKKHQIEDAILGVKNIADFNDDETTDIKLPDGKIISFPFETRPKLDLIELSPNQKYFNFCTMLNFPIDEQIKEYIENNTSQKNHDKASIGCIYLNIKVGEKYSEFSFTAATSNMSRLFLESKSIQQTFINLLDQTEGLFGLIDIEESFYLSLYDLNKKVGNCGKQKVENDFDPLDNKVDEFTEICLIHRDCCSLQKPKSEF